MRHLGVVTLILVVASGQRYGGYGSGYRRVPSRGYGAPYGSYGSRGAPLNGGFPGPAFGGSLGGPADFSGGPPVANNPFGGVPRRVNAGLGATKLAAGGNQVGTGANVGRGVANVGLLTGFRGQPVGGGPAVAGSDRYYLSWVAAPNTKYTWDEADHNCRSLGYRLISIKDATTDRFISDALLANELEYIWTSGTRVAGTNKFQWGDGSSVYRYTNWSRTGGDGQAQPDDREGQENCLAVLNNFYQDGVVWHDIACHHRKYFICEKY